MFIDANLYFLFQFCPTWIAPNVLTFSGFLFTVVNFVMFAYFDPNFHASSIDVDKQLYPPIPRWVFLLAAINLFLAHTLGEENMNFKINSMVQPY